MVRSFVRKPVVPKEKQSVIPVYVVPVMVFIDSMPNDKVLYRYLFPENAEIISFMINFRGLKAKLRIIADLKVEGGGEYIEFDVEDGINKLLESKNVLEGTTVELSVPDYVEGTHGNPEIWISYLYRIVN